MGCLFYINYFHFSNSLSLFLYESLSISTVGELDVEDDSSWLRSFMLLLVAPTQHYLF